MIQKTSCDCLCIIDKNVPQELLEQFSQLRSFDKGFDAVVSCFKSQRFNMPVVYSPIPELNEYMDVRVYQKAASKCIERAVNVW